MARAVHLRRMGGGPPAIEVGHRASDLSVMVIFVAVRLSYVARLARHRCAERFPTSNPCAFLRRFGHEIVCDRTVLILPYFTSILLCSHCPVPCMFVDVHVFADRSSMEAAQGTRGAANGRWSRRRQRSVVIGAHASLACDYACCDLERIVRIGSCTSW